MDQQYASAVAGITRGLVEAFGDGVHLFGWQAARTRAGGLKAVGTGPDAGKKPKYGKQAEAALAADKKGGAKPAPAKGDSPAPPRDSRPRATPDAALAKVKELHAGALDPNVSGDQLRQQVAAAVSGLSGADLAKVHAGLGYKARPKNRAATVAAIVNHVTVRRGAYERAQVAREGPLEPTAPPPPAAQKPVPKRLQPEYVALAPAPAPAKPAAPAPPAPSPVSPAPAAPAPAAPGKPLKKWTKIGSPPPGYSRDGTPSDDLNRRAFNALQARGAKLPEYMPDVDYTRPMGKAPPASPAETKAIAGHVARDTRRYGPRAARALQAAAAAVRGLFTLSGLSLGTAVGATVGTALGGPLGTALGVAVGGGLGGLAGSKARLPGSLGRAERGQLAPADTAGYTALGPRLAVQARKVARGVAPRVAGAMAAAPALGAGIAAGLAGPAIGGAVAGPIGSTAGLIGGVALGIQGGDAAGRAYDRTSRQVRARMATSAAAKRQAARRESRGFAEVFAEAGLPMNAVALVKVRLMLAARKAGVTLPPIPDDVVAKALELAAKGG